MIVSTCGSTEYFGLSHSLRKSVTGNGHPVQVTDVSVAYHGSMIVARCERFSRPTPGCRAALRIVYQQSALSVFHGPVRSAKRLPFIELYENPNGHRSDREILARSRTFPRTNFAGANQETGMANANSSVSGCDTNPKRQRGPSLALCAWCGDGEKSAPRNGRAQMREVRWASGKRGPGGSLSRSSWLQSARTGTAKTDKKERVST